MTRDDSHSETRRQAEGERQKRMCVLFAISLVGGVALVFLAATADCFRIGSFDPLRGAVLDLVFLGTLLGMGMSPFVVLAILKKRTAMALAWIYGPVVLAVVAIHVIAARPLGAYWVMAAVFVLACVLVDRFLPDAVHEGGKQA